MNRAMTGHDMCTHLTAHPTQELGEPWKLSKAHRTTHPSIRQAEFDGNVSHLSILIRPTDKLPLFCLYCDYTCLVRSLRRLQPTPHVQQVSGCADPPPLLPPPCRFLLGSPIAALVAGVDQPTRIDIRAAAVAFQKCWARLARLWGPLLPRRRLPQLQRVPVPLHAFPIWTRRTTCARSCVPPPAARPLPHLDLAAGTATAPAAAAAAAALAPLGIIHNNFRLVPILPYNLNHDHNCQPPTPPCICRHPPNPLPLVFPALALALALASALVQGKEPCLQQHPPRQVLILLLLLPAIALSTTTAHPHTTLSTRLRPNLRIHPPRMPSLGSTCQPANHSHSILVLWRLLMLLISH